MITRLSSNEIFVFGSNTLGLHGAGAARQAVHFFGAELGVGEGHTGQCYAFPTLNASFTGGSLQLEQRTTSELVESARKLWVYASNNPDLTLLLTPVGCGLARYSEKYMKTFFVNMPDNVRKPVGW
jgi:hypothetical protein